MISFPGSKINIGLNILSKRDDGFHNLQSIFYPVGWSDTLEMLRSKQLSLKLHNQALNIPSEQNIVWKAYQLLKREQEIYPVEMHLLKTVPSGAGLGGGSANGSAALKLLNDTFRLNLSLEQLESYAAELGSDCPFFIKNTPAYVTGRGEFLEAIDLDLSSYYLGIVYPGIQISTQEAFAGIVPKSSSVNLKEVTEQSPDQWKDLITNDFEKTVFKLYPQLAELKIDLYSKGALYASLTGTGSCVYGLFEEHPDLSDFNAEGWKTHISRL